MGYVWKPDDSELFKPSELFIQSFERERRKSNANAELLRESA